VITVGREFLVNRQSASDQARIDLAFATFCIIAAGFAGDAVWTANTAGTGITAHYYSATEILTLSGYDGLTRGPLFRDFDRSRAASERASVSTHNRGGR
jgi:hypothetical protein